MDVPLFPDQQDPPDSAKFYLFISRECAYEINREFATIRGPWLNHTVPDAGVVDGRINMVITQGVNTYPIRDSRPNGSSCNVRVAGGNAYWYRPIATAGGAVPAIQCVELASDLFPHRETLQAPRNSRYTGPGAENPDLRLTV